MSSRRIVRKQPLLSKIKSFPFDFLLYLNEVRLSIEWDDYTGTLAFPLGVALTSSSLIIKTILSYYDSVNSKSNNLLFNSDYHQYQRLKNNIVSRRIPHPQEEFTDEVPITTSIIWLLNIVSSLINVIMLMNTYSIITKKKNYGLLYCQSKPKSPSVIKSSIESISYVTQAFKYLVSCIFDKEEHDITVEVDEDDEIDENEIWQLNVWDPSKFSIFVFIALNPISLLVIHNFDPSDSSLLYTILLISLVSVTIYYFVENFLDLIHDKQILYQEMFNEYNKKFVQPKMSILKKDVLIDATLGPFESSVLTDVRPYAFNKSKLWVTHDLKGNQVVDYGESYDDSLEYQQGDRNVPFVDFNLANDSNQLLNRLRVDYDELRVKNQELCKQISRLTRSDGFYENEFDNTANFQTEPEEVDDSDEDRSWYTSSTPYKIKRENQNRNVHSTEIRDRGTSIPHRSPSPTKLFARSPSLRDRSPTHTSFGGIPRERSPIHNGSFRERSHSQTSLGGRSPSHASLSGRSPTLTRTRNDFFRPPPNTTPNGFQENIYGIPSSSLRSPSPTKFPQSQTPFKSPSPVKGSRSPKRWP